MQANPPIEYVKWIDSTGDGHWQEAALAMLMRPQEVVTIGFLLNEDGDAITLMQSYAFGHDSVDNIICIPKVSVTDRVTLTIEDIWGKAADAVHS